MTGRFEIVDDLPVIVAERIRAAEPIDDAEPESFFPSPIDTNFRVTYAPRMVVAPHGGSSPSIEIRVQPK